MEDNTLKEIFDSLEFDRDEKTAKAYGITLINGELFVKAIAESRDIYEMLEDINKDKLVHNTNFDYFTMITHGWAAPLDSNGEIDGPPSQSDNRRRVRLVIAVDINNNFDLASIVQFSDDPDDLLFDHDVATGPLSEAVKELFV